MKTAKVHITGAGMAQWGRPTRKTAELQTMNYETFLMFRFEFANGRRFHMPTYIAGMDDINARGEVPYGFGHLEFHDEDKDFLYAYVDWSEVDGRESGHFKVNSGTGKWAGASGEFELELWGAPAFADTVLPATGPVKFVGFLEGDAVLQLPNFPG